MKRRVTLILERADEQIDVGTMEFYIGSVITTGNLKLDIVCRPTTSLPTRSCVIPITVTVALLGSICVG